MFIRALHYEVMPGRFEDAERLFRSEVFPRLEREPGFLRAILTGDAESGCGVLYTMWQTEDFATRYVSSGDAGALLAPFVELLAKPPETVGYPVLFDREF